jgi:hypothetical protein
VTRLSRDGAQRGKVVALLRADHGREQLHKLDAEDDQRPQQLFLIGAGKEILVMVVEQGGLLALAQGGINNFHRPRAILGKAIEIRHRVTVLLAGSPGEKRGLSVGEASAWQSESTAGSRARYARAPKAETFGFGPVWLRLANSMVDIVCNIACSRRPVIS